MVLFSVQPSSKYFDITLMICLLRNLIPIVIMDDKLPLATDTSLGADLSRIKFYRSFIVHCDSALVDDTDFESYWNDVTLVMHNNLHLFYIVIIFTRTFRTWLQIYRGIKVIINYLMTETVDCPPNAS
jgi:hypothetical protein